MQPRPLIVVERDALVVVIGEIGRDELRRLVERQQPLLGGGDGGAVGRMQMHDAAGVLAHLVHRRMDGEAGGIDGIRRRPTFSPFMSILTSEEAVISSNIMP